MNSHTQVEHVLKLLEQSTSLAVLGDFLKSKNLPHSAGSWKAASETRIKPAIESGDLTVQDLIDLLSSAEECGRQHIFLYKCKASDAQEFLLESRIKKILASMGIANLLDQSAILEQPDDLTISAVRLHNGKLTITLLETRISYELLEEINSGDTLSVRYRKIPKRAVNVIRLNPNGLLEVRVGAYESGRKYITEVARIMNSVKKLLTLDSFKEVSLSQLKNRLVNDQDSLSKVIKFNETILVDDEGFKLTAASGSGNADIGESKGLRSSMDAYISCDAYCDSSSFRFKAFEGGPIKDITVRIAGEVNEFILPAHCNVGEYEYSLEQIVHLNK